MTARTAALAKIHLAKKQLAMADEDYRALLQRVAQVRSAADLNRAGFDAVLAEMVRLGFKPTAKPRSGKKPNPTASRAALMRKIEAQLAEAGYPWAYADALAQRMYRIDKADWLDATQLQGLIAALYRDAVRKGRATRAAV